MSNKVLIVGESSKSASAALIADLARSAGFEVEIVTNPGLAIKGIEPSLFIFDEGLMASEIAEIGLCAPTVEDTLITRQLLQRKPIAYLGVNVGAIGHVSPRKTTLYQAIKEAKAGGPWGQNKSDRKRNRKNRWR